MSSFPQDPCVYSDKPPLCCCIECRMSLWRRQAEAVLSVCVHLSAPSIFWVGWIAVREKLCGPLVWLTDMKAKAALTIAAVAWACSVFLSKACCAPSWSSQHEGHPNCLVPSSPFVLDWCVHVYVHPYLCVCVCIYMGIWCLSSVSIAHTGTASSWTAHLCSHLDVAGKKKKIWHCWFLQGCDESWDDQCSSKSLSL